MQWGGIKNGELLTQIELEHFNVFLTGDNNMENQQRLEGRSFAVPIMSAINWPRSESMFSGFLQRWKMRGPARLA